MNFTAGQSTVVTKQQLGQKVSNPAEFFLMKLTRSATPKNEQPPPAQMVKKRLVDFMTYNLETSDTLFFEAGQDVGNKFSANKALVESVSSTGVDLTGRRVGGPEAS